MNFRTTIILLLLLAVVGLFLLLGEHGDQSNQQTTAAKLLELAPGDEITRIVISSDDQTLTLEKDQDKWRLTSPVSAPAEELTVSSFLDTLTSLQSRQQVEPQSTGVDQPRRKIELTTRQNRTIRLDVGDRTSAGDNLYVRLDSRRRVDVVPASLDDQLDRPLKDWRRAKLLDVSASDLRQIRIATTQQSLELLREGEQWKLIRPTSMPADSSEVSDITFGLSSLRVVDFVSESADDLKRYGLDHPTASVWFSTQPPSTQPSTQPTFTAVHFGRFDDVMKKNVYASSPQGMGPGVVKVAASALDWLRKTPLELRDRNVLSVQAEQVSRIVIDGKKQVILQRAKPLIGPPSTSPTPATAPATTQATTQPTTEPLTQPSKWRLASAGDADADDAKVEDLLREFHPLRAQKFLESAPTTQPAATFVITLDTADAAHQIRIVDPGNDQPLIGQYNDLTFELGRWLLNRLDAEFVNHHEEQAGSSG